MLHYEIMVDHSESSNKCTILPLAYRTDFTIIRGWSEQPLRSQILLHPNGPHPTEIRQALSAATSIAAIDCIWRRLEPIMARLSPPLPQLVKIPEEFVTAYPRKSQAGFDPSGGLATIEALFIAAAFTGRWDLSLLREYYFGEQFLTLNDAAFRHYGISPTVPPDNSIYSPVLPRNSHQRRIARGRTPKGDNFP